MFILNCKKDIEEKNLKQFIVPGVITIESLAILILGKLFYDEKNQSINDDQITKEEIEKLKKESIDKKIKQLEESIEFTKRQNNEQQKIAQTESSIKIKNLEKNIKELEDKAKDFEKNFTYSIDIFMNEIKKIYGNNMKNMREIKEKLKENTYLFETKHEDGTPIENPVNEEWNEYFQKLSDSIDNSMIDSFFILIKKIISNYAKDKNILNAAISNIYFLISQNITNPYSADFYCKIIKRLREEALDGQMTFLSKEKIECLKNISIIEGDIDMRLQNISGKDIIWVL